MNKYLNVALTAILVLAIAYNLMRGWSAEIDATAHERMRFAERERDSLAREAYSNKVAMESLLLKADSLSALLDSARVARPPVEVARREHVEAMRYVPLDVAIDTLRAE